MGYRPSKLAIEIACAVVAMQEHQKQQENQRTGNAHSAPDTHSYQDAQENESGDGQKTTFSE